MLGLLLRTNRPNRHYCTCLLATLVWLPSLSMANTPILPVSKNYNNNNNKYYSNKNYNSKNYKSKTTKENYNNYNNNNHDIVSSSNTTSGIFLCILLLCLLLLASLTPSTRYVSEILTFAKKNKQKLIIFKIQKFKNLAFQNSNFQKKLRLTRNIKTY